LTGCRFSQVVFSPDSNHRRKSSLVESDDPRIRRRRSETYDKNTACFVHSLLNGSWIAPPGTLGEIDESAGEPVDDVQPAAKDNILEEHDRVSVVDYGSRVAEQSAPAVVHSRHLTKRQLSDMAWNVRKLSKRLGSIKLKLTVKTVILVTKVYDESLIKLTRELTQWLLSKERQTQYTVYVENVLRDHPNFNADSLIEEEPSVHGRLKYWDVKLTANRPQTFDFAITLGGDGTVLYTSWLFQRIVPPVLSFSLGSLGFLTKFDFGSYKETLTKAFRDGVIVSLRLRFECTIMRNNPRRAPKVGSDGYTIKKDLVDDLVGEEVDDTLTHIPDKVFEILNDVVVDRGPNASTYIALGIIA
jgi:NAD+ kinase